MIHRERARLRLVHPCHPQGSLGGPREGSGTSDHSATDIRLRAERRAGQLLAEMGERGERREHSERGRGSMAQPLPPRLSDLGVTKTQSSDGAQERGEIASGRPKSIGRTNTFVPRWQKLGALDDDAFETRVATAQKQAACSV